jgi:hypothetical protein
MMAANLVSYSNVVTQTQATPLAAAHAQHCWQHGKPQTSHSMQQTAAAPQPALQTQGRLLPGCVR